MTLKFGHLIAHLVLLNFDKYLGSKNWKNSVNWKFLLKRNSGNANMHLTSVLLFFQLPGVFLWYYFNSKYLKQIYYAGMASLSSGFTSKVKFCYACWITRIPGSIICLDSAERVVDGKICLLTIWDSSHL